WLRRLLRCVGAAGRTRRGCCILPGQARAGARLVRPGRHLLDARSTSPERRRHRRAPERTRSTALDSMERPEALAAAGAAPAPAAIAAAAAQPLWRELVRS